MGNQFFSFVQFLGGWWLSLRRTRRSCRRRLAGCVALLLLLLLTSCGLLFWLAQAANAGALEPEPLVISLLIDNSNSMFEKGGLGSDPEQLRLDAARLFITYLGVDDGRVTHGCGLIFFGTTAEEVAPLTWLNGEQQRQELLQRLQEPARLGWTDHVAALTLAQAQLQPYLVGTQPALVLLTDGKPEWGDQPTAAEQAAYLERLQQLGRELADDRIPLFIILLANEATDADRDIDAVWRPTWQQLAAATSPGRFYEARQAADLPGIYHDIVVTLTGSQTAGRVLQGEVGAAGLRQTITVEPGLARLTLVISKSRPELTVALLQPGAVPVTAETPGVRRAGQSGAGREEIWVIDQPVAGDWTILISGVGQVTVWQDYLPATATPLPSATPFPSPTPTAAATATLTPTPLPTATPEAAATQVVMPAQPASTSVTRQLPATPAPTLGRWLLALFLAVAGIGYGIYRRWQRRRPVVTGTLRVLAGPGFLGGEPAYELEGLHRQRVQIGPGPAGLVLPDASHAFTLRVGLPLDTGQEVLISGPEAILVNDRPLLHEQPLYDTDIITVGDNRLRYDNLALRRPQPHSPARLSQAWIP